MQFISNTTLATRGNTTNLHSNKVCKSLGCNIYFFGQHYNNCLLLNLWNKYRSRLDARDEGRDGCFSFASIKLRRRCSELLQSFVIYWYRAAWFTKCIFSNLGNLQYWNSPDLLKLQPEDIAANMKENLNSVSWKIIGKSKKQWTKFLCITKLKSIINSTDVN